ncbi:hypothetical protein ACFQZZ_08745 [Nocardia sp. GCM10030253]|uniref:hypothetical protein n=1 Tax=Nocardia sp. GCM10030253 TaxID=3273404 RepID=UPI003643DC63
MNMENEKETYGITPPISINIHEAFQGLESYIEEQDDDFDVDAGWARLERVIDDDRAAGDDPDSGAPPQAPGQFDTVVEPLASVLAFAEAAENRQEQNLPPMRAATTIGFRPPPMPWFSAALAFTTAAFSGIVAIMLLASRVEFWYPMLVSGVLTVSLIGLALAAMEARRRRLIRERWRLQRADASVFTGLHRVTTSSCACTNCDGGAHTVRKTGLRIDERVTPIGERRERRWAQLAAMAGPGMAPLAGLAPLGGLAHAGRK